MALHRYGGQGAWRASDAAAAEGFDRDADTDGHEASPGLVVRPQAPPTRTPPIPDLPL